MNNDAYLPARAKRKWVNSEFVGRCVPGRDTPLFLYVWQGKDL
jgi:hypothetical protein